jgi:hypothetical protein
MLPAFVDFHTTFAKLEIMVHMIPAIEERGLPPTIFLGAAPNSSKE